MRIVLDLMPEDPDPVERGSQGTVVDADQFQILIDWDEDVGRSLHLIPGVDQYHILNSHNPDEMRKSWENLKLIQERVEKGSEAFCPRCGREFDVHSGAVSRRIRYCNISLCDFCGQQEAIEDFITHGSEMGYEIENFIGVENISKKRLDYFIEQRSGTDLRNKAERILKSSQEAGLSIVIREDIQYPDRFRNLTDMPILIYCKGVLRVNEYADTVGIVGARRCSAAGKEKAIAVVAEEAETAAIVSGMAKGIDSYAQTAAVKMRRYTIAILGNGADICYPKEHEKLYKEIVTNGCVLSEYPPGAIPRTYYFPRRNRLIAALSDKLYVIDAGRKSGTESTITASRKYGKMVVKCSSEAFEPCKSKIYCGNCM